MDWLKEKMEWTKDRNKLTGLLSVLFVHIVLIIILSFVIMKPPFPPPPQIGVEVNLGNSNNGMGDIQTHTPKEVAASKPQTTKKVDNVATQSTQETVNLNNKKVNKTTPKPVVDEKPDEPVVNKDFIFSSEKNTKGSSEGKTGKSGDQGMENGDPNANNYVGDGGSGGVTFSLSGRKQKNLPEPLKNYSEEGKVVVKIWVNKEGKVINAIVASDLCTTTSRVLKKLALEAALKAQFDSKPDAAVAQKGSITYVFKIEN